MTNRRTRDKRLASLKASHESELNDLLLTGRVVYDENWNHVPLIEYIDPQPQEVIEKQHEMLLNQRKR